MDNIVNVRGINFNNLTMDEVILEIEKRMASGSRTVVFTPNSEIVQACIEDNSLYEVFNSADIIIPDGIGVVKAAKILKTPLKGKVAGYELGERIIEKASSSGDSAICGSRISIFGGKPCFSDTDKRSVAEVAAAKMTEKYPGATFCMTRHGYFKKEGEENDETIRLINESAADVLIVCLGVPVQEKWILENKTRLPGVKLFLALGGSVDGYSGNVKRAPKIFIKLSLEWLYRFLVQPSRFFRILKLPKFYFGTWIYKLFRSSNTQ